jgi:hypothetical protein
MTDKQKSQPDTVFLNGVPINDGTLADQDAKVPRRWRKGLGVAVLAAVTCFTAPTFAHAQFGSLFSSIFGSIQNDMGKSLSTINQLRQQTQQLYQTTMWPLAAINQVRGFVSNSISTYRNALSQMFKAPTASATLAGPQQFESLLHSRLTTQIPPLQSNFTSTFGAIPAANTASPQDRVLIDIDDALAQQNLKTTVISDQASDLILQTADQMENQVALSTPGSNPYLTAQGQVVILRGQAYMQKMLAAELRQEAGRIAHDNALAKRRSTAAGGIGGLISGALSNR